MRIDVVTIFPEYLAPLGALADRQGPGKGCSTCGCTTCATSPRPPPDRRRLANGVAQMVMRRAVGGGAGRPPRRLEASGAWGSTTACRSTPARPGPAGCRSPRPWPGRCRRTRGWPPPAAYEGIDERRRARRPTRMPVTVVSLGTTCQRGRGRRAGHGRGGRPAAAASSATPVRRGVARGRAAGVPPVYTKPAVWRGNEVPEVLRFRRPRGHCPVAARAAAGADSRTSARPARVSQPRFVRDPIGPRHAGRRRTNRRGGRRDSVQGGLLWQTGRLRPTTRGPCHRGSATPARGRQDAVPTLMDAGSSARTDQR